MQRGDIRQGVPDPSKRRVVSQVLKEQRDWIQPENKLPDECWPVVIRLCHRTNISGETPWEIFPLEDIQIGHYYGGKWYIHPPFPKYDYSLLSNKETIKENVDVTHWAIPKDGELEGWQTRFNRIGTYKKLELNVDSENEEMVYKALLHGAHFISQFGGADYHNAKPGEGLRKYHEILCDLQQSIDTNTGLQIIPVHIHPHISTMITENTEEGD